MLKGVIVLSNRYSYRPTSAKRIAVNNVRFDLNPCTWEFYAVCNSLFTYVSGVDEVALLTSQVYLSVFIFKDAAVGMAHVSFELYPLSGD